MLTEQDIYDARILIIDDNQENVELLENILATAGYSSVLSITDSRKAAQLYAAYKPHLVLLDINMPYLNGYQVMEKLKEVEGGSYIPVLVLTALRDHETRIRALSGGAQDFLTKPFDQLETTTRIANILKVRLLHNEVKNQNIILERKIQERTFELHDTRLEIIHRLGRAAEYRDNETGAHIIRLSHMCALLGKLAGLSERRQELLLNATPMHDIGKIGIPDNILLKPGKLDNEEWQIMQTHTTIGADLLSGHDSELMTLSRDIALTHHEKWNGTGYPRKLRGEKIPFAARITGLMDVFDALTSKRPYKDPYPIEKACDTIKAECGKHFDPRLTDLFLENLGEFKQIKIRFSDKGETAHRYFQLSERDKEGI
ncbi:MAG: response regulator [Deltaproteobacteria bacterium]|nr:response regulator [Deltaproteobacteria bacterium]